MDRSRREFLRKSAEFGLLAATVASGCASTKTLRRLAAITDSDPNLQEFEYIVVGTGAGGGPLACRLALAGKKVLLLEAGSHDPEKENLNYQIPVFHGKSTEDPDMAWRFYVKHYKDNFARDSKYQPEKGGILYPRAATVGGCTAHNAMITLYPNNSDWDEIAKITDDRSWRSGNMWKYYERLHKNQNKQNGWLHTEQTSPFLLANDVQLLEIVSEALGKSGLGKEIVSKLINQGANLGLDPNNRDYVNYKQDGLFNIPKATLNGSRNGTREFIYDTIEKTEGKLVLRTGCLASQLIAHPNNDKEIIGVEYYQGSHLYSADPNFTSGRNGVKKFAKVTKEVILAGGAFNSPQLLMLSGIGNKKDSANFKHHLPGVGKNLQDRYEVGVVMKLNEDLDLVKNCTFGADKDPCMDEWRKNPKDSVYGSNGVAIAMIKKSYPSKPDPDLCIFGVPGNFTGYFDGWSKDALKDKKHFTWAILKGRTGNKNGEVKLKSESPFDTPDINFNYFSQDEKSAISANHALEDDLDAVMSGVKTARKINEAFIARGKAIEELPGNKIKSDQNIKDFVLNNAWGHHASCSNQMGKNPEKGAVVDSQFRVHGFKRLRIVDASVFPRVPGLFIVLPTYMISEKAAEDLLFDSDDWSAPT